MSKERRGGSRRIQIAKARTRMESRRRFLKLAGVTTLTVAAGGASLYLVDRFRDSQISLRKDFPEVNEHYPELSPSSVKQAFSFSLGEANIVVLNFTSLELNEDAARDVYEKLDFLARKYNSVNFPVDVRGEKIRGAIRPNTSDKIMFIVPNSAPAPSWATHNFGSTELDPILPSKSFVRVSSAWIADFYEGSNLPPLIFSTNLIFATEACQATVEAGIGQDVPDSYAPVMQEIVCNSLGRAMVLRQAGATYDEYIKFLGESTIERPGTSEEYGLISLLEEDYILLPIVPVFK